MEPKVEIVRARVCCHYLHVIAVQCADNVDALSSTLFDFRQDYHTVLCSFLCYTRPALRSIVAVYSKIFMKGPSRFLRGKRVTYCCDVTLSMIWGNQNALTVDNSIID